MFRHAATIFLSALMLFQVQPLVGRYILPWFGGSPAVWTTCMLLFQVLLLVGYAYAHILSARANPRTQALVHLCLLSASLFWLPLAPSDAWKPTGEESPTWHILALLTATIGGPYLLLSATGPLVQNWFARTYPDRSPYRLYALSNVGSLLALVSYPFVLEPLLPLGQQTRVWTAGYLLFVACCAWCAIRFYNHAERLTPSVYAAAIKPHAKIEIPPLRLIGSWLALSACGSVVLLATTNQMCQEVAVVPFLWVLPLAIYLMSFILTFDSDRWYRRTPFGILLGVSVIGATFAVDADVTSAIWLKLQLATFAVALFAATMVCHGELAASRPHTRHLTLFYLCVAAGGAAGGVAVALIAPLFFSGYWEYQLGLCAACLLALAAYRRADGANFAFTQRTLIRTCTVLAALLVTIVSLGKNVLSQQEDLRLADRNFYGVLRVRDTLGEEPENNYRWLAHGRIKHGMQFMSDDMRRTPTTYYAPTSGVGLAIEAQRAHIGNERGLRIGVVGLGAGTLAAYGRPGDTIRFYEINPTVADVARDYFTYLADSPAEVDVVLGDARIQMERELGHQGGQQFDVLAVDAFSGDAIPLHLLTRECFAVYGQHLRPDAILALHISNRNVDLAPVVRGLAAELGQHVVWIQSQEDAKTGANTSDWLLVSRDPAALDVDVIAKAVKAWPEDAPRPLIWTDDHASLSQVLTK